MLESRAFGHEASTRGGGASPASSPVKTAPRVPPIDRVSPIRELRQLAELLSKYVRGQPLHETIDISRGTGLRAKSVNAQEFIDALRVSTGGFIALGKFLETVNRFGSRDPRRDLAVSLELLPIAMHHVDCKKVALTERQPAKVSREEDLLHSLYLRANRDTIALSEWYRYGSPFIRLHSQMENLPGPEAYLALSRSRKEEFLPHFKELKSKQQSKASELTKASSFELQAQNDKENGSSLRKSADECRARAETIGQQIEELSKKLYTIAATITDVDPIQLDTVVAETQLSVSLKPAVLDGLLGDLKLVAKLLQISFGTRAIDPTKPDTYDLHELIATDMLSGSAPAWRVAPQELEAVLRTPEMQAELLGIFHGLRSTLDSAFISIPRDPFHEMDALRRRIAPEFSKIIPVENDAELVSAILAHSEPAIREAAGKLLTGKIRKLQGSTYKTENYFESPENIRALAWAVEDLIFGLPENAKRLESAMRQTGLEPLLRTTTGIRILMAQRDVVQIARLIDDEIKACKEETKEVPYARLAGVLLSMQVLSKDEFVRRNVKSLLQRLDDISDLSRSLTANLTASNSPVAKYVEDTRRSVTRLYSVDRSDYWGYEDIVNTLTELIEKHVLLLENKSAWSGRSPGEVFLNGIILYGDPGVGKTFLVQCLGNTMGMPILRISREEMSTAYQDAKRSSESWGQNKALLSETEERMERQLAKFIQTKIEEAAGKMRKDNSPACILFFDEIEGEMIERQLVKNSPEQIALTNAMLRVIEREVTKHPEIIFMAATNHIDLVDRAALRLGRFGIHIELKGPQIEDVKVIISKMLESLESPLPGNAQSEEFKKLANECLGLNPLPIKVALTNLCCAKKAELIKAKANPAVSLSFEELLQAVGTIKRLTALPVQASGPDLEHSAERIAVALEKLVPLFESLLKRLSPTAGDNRE